MQASQQEEQILGFLHHAGLFVSLSVEICIQTELQIELNGHVYMSKWQFDIPQSHLILSSSVRYTSHGLYT